MDLVSSLIHQSFSPKEADIYLACLQLKQANASTIARVSGHNRSTTYSILKELQSKGYITAIDKNSILSYSATPPEAIARQLEEKFHQFKELLPAFSSFAEKFGIAPRVEFFEGKDNIMTMYDDLLHSTTEIRALLGTSQFPDYITKYLTTTFFPTKIARNISSKTIISDTPSNRDHLPHTINDGKKRERKTIPGLTFMDHIIINIYGPDKVMFAVFDESYPFGIIISSHYLYQTLGGVFDYLRQKE